MCYIDNIVFQKKKKKDNIEIEEMVLACVVSRTPSHFFNTGFVFFF